MKRILVLLALLFSANAYAEDEVQTVTFKNGATYRFTAEGPSGTGTRYYSVTKNGKSVAVETLNGKTLSQEMDEISCHELAYKPKRNQLSCTDKSMTGWFTTYYRDSANGLEIVKAEQGTISADPVKPITVYSRPSHAKTY